LEGVTWCTFRILGPYPYIRNGLSYKLIIWHAVWSPVAITRKKRKVRPNLVWKGSHDHLFRILGPLHIWRTVSARNLIAQFELSTSNSSRDVERSQNCKSRSRDRLPFPIDLIFIVSVPGGRISACLIWSIKRWSICMSKVKFLAETVLELWRWS